MSQDAHGQSQELAVLQQHLHFLLLHGKYCPDGILSRRRTKVRQQHFYNGFLTLLDILALFPPTISNISATNVQSSQFPQLLHESSFAVGTRLTHHTSLYKCTLHCILLVQPLQAGHNYIARLELRVVSCKKTIIA